MPYQAAISRQNPSAFLFILDQSGSMDEAYESGKSKAEQLALVVNRVLTNLIVRCTKAEGVRDYFHVGILGYGSHGIVNLLPPALGNEIMHPISALEANPLRIEERRKKEDDGAGGVLERVIKFPVWVEPRAYGGTPMCEALTKAAEELAAWSDAHGDSYPPAILHITDGEANDGTLDEVEELGNQITQIGTNDGPLLLLNMHLTADGGQAVHFPSSEAGLASLKSRDEPYAKMLFRMSSIMPKPMLGAAREKGYQVENDARGYIFNGGELDIADFFDIGTRGSAAMR